LGPNPKGTFPGENETWDEKDQLCVKSRPFGKEGIIKERALS